MVSTRRQSLPAPETPAHASTSHRASSTLDDIIPSPTVHLTHADELLVREATAILGHDPSSSRPTARALRHAKLTEARSVSPVSVRRSRTPSLAPSDISTPSRRPSSHRSTPRPGSGLVPPERRTARLSSGSGSALAMDLQAEFPTSQAQAAAGDASSSDESTSDSDSDSDSDDSDTSENDDDEEEERLEKLLQAARLSAQQKGKGKETLHVDAREESEDVLQLDKEDEENVEAPIPNLKIPSLPTPYLFYGPDGTAVSGSKHRTKTTTRDKPTPDPATFEVDDTPYQKELSQRRKAAQPRKATISEQWATLPAPKRDDLQQMKRDYQALALATSLDPKRFMKGGTKLTKVPETFAIGHVIEQSRQVRDTTLHRDIRYQPGSIVQDLIRDEGTGSYAKRKYGDLQKSRMDNGRGKGWKKRSKW